VARKYFTVARDYTIFRMLELTGLRTHEIIMMDVKDCRFDLYTKDLICKYITDTSWHLVL